MKTPKLCKDCKWYVEDKEHSKCSAPPNIVIDLINGDRCYRWAYCGVQRGHNWFTALGLKQCGRGGRWWEPKTGDSDAKQATIPCDAPQPADYK